MKNIFSIVFIVAAGLGLIWLALPESAKMSLAAIVKVGTESAISKMESQLDQGQLALEHVDGAYRTAERKLVQLKALKLDAGISLQQAKDRSNDYEKKGRADLAAKNQSQVEFFQNQVEGYERSIASRTKRLKEIDVLRSRAREDVRLVREKIAYLKATIDALDTEGQQEALDKAEQLVNQMHHSCNVLTAEVDVLNMMEE